MKIDGNKTQDHEQLLIDIPVKDVTAPRQIPIKRKRHAILYRYSFFGFMNACMILAFFTSNYGGSKGQLQKDYQKP